MTSIEASPARPNSGESADGSPSESKLWCSPIATLPLWPVLLVSGVGMLVLSPSFTVLAGRWRGIEYALPYALALGWWWVSARRRGYSMSDVMGQRPSLEHLGLMLIAMLATRGVHLGWLASLTVLDVMPESWLAQAAVEAPPRSRIDLLLIALIGPCAEEILFRGQIFRRSLRWMRPIPAALWSSLFFGICHLDTLGGTLFALVMVGLYLQSGSLWVPIAAHVSSNAMAVFMPGMMAALLAPHGAVAWALAAAQLVCVPWVAWFLFRTLRQLRQLRQLEGGSP